MGTRKVCSLSECPKIHKWQTATLPKHFFLWLKNWEKHHTKTNCNSPNLLQLRSNVPSFPPTSRPTPPSCLNGTFLISFSPYFLWVICNSIDWNDHREDFTSFQHPVIQSVHSHFHGNKGPVSALTALPTLLLASFLPGTNLGPHSGAFWHVATKPQTFLKTTLLRF